jgi:hypothetical protein
LLLVAVWAIAADPTTTAAAAPAKARYLIIAKSPLSPREAPQPNGRRRTRFRTKPIC